MTTLRVVVLVVLVIGSSAAITPIPAQAATADLHVYESCTGDVQTPCYESLQTAVDDAAAGDTIQVHPGTYAESVDIAKSLTITGDTGGTEIGAGSDAPVLDGEYQRSWGINLTEDVSGVTIEGLEITRYISAGVRAWNDGTTTVVVRDNTVYDIDAQGILVGNHGGGVHENLTVRRNAVEDAVGTGIEIWNVRGADVVTNDVTGSEGVGQSGAEDSSTGLTVGVLNRSIAGNAGIVVEDNAMIGAFVDEGIAVGSLNGSLAGVVVRDNVIDAHFDSDALVVLARKVDGSSARLENVTVSGTRARGSLAAGVLIEPRSDALVDEVVLQNNTVSGNAVGISIDEWPGGTLGTVDVRDNTLSGNDDDGLRVVENASAGNVTVDRNDIVGNGALGVNNAGSGTLDALDNWWGHATGPSHATANPTGQGDQVSDNVSFEPWLETPALSAFDAAIPGTGADGPPLDPDDDGLYDDVDGNGAVDFDDAIALAFANTGSLTADQLDALDFDDDGDVDFDDAIELAFQA